MRYHNITKDDMLNGDGLRAVLWVAGCTHKCKGCHNPVTWDIEGGIPFDDAAKEETVAQDHENRAMKEKMALDGSVQVDFEDRKKTKNELKQQLYYLLTVYAGKTLPWGTLTGIRPTKIPMELLEGEKAKMRFVLI